MYWHQAAGLVPNVEVCSILLRQSNMNFIYKMYVMQTMKTRRIRPSASIIEQLEEDITRARKMIVKKVNIQDLVILSLITDVTFRQKET